MAGVNYIEENVKPKMGWNESNPQDLQNICCEHINNEEINKMSSVFARRFNVPRENVQHKFKHIDDINDPDYRNHVRIVYYIENYTCGGQMYPEKILMEDTIKLPSGMLCDG